MKAYERIILILIMICSPIVSVIGIIEWLVVGKSKVFKYIGSLMEKAVD